VLAQNIFLSIAVIFTFFYCSRVETPTQLEEDELREFLISGKQPITVDLFIKKPGFFLIQINQCNLDIEVSFFDENNNLVFIDSPTGNSSPEKFHFKKLSPGAFSFKVYSIDKPERNGYITLGFTRATLSNRKSSTIESERLFFNGYKISSSKDPISQKKAIKYFQKSITLINREDFSEFTGLAFQQIAKIYYRLEDFPKALENFFIALEIFANFGNQKKISQSFSDIASCYHRVYNLESAEHFYQRSLFEYSKSELKSDLSVTYSNLSFLQNQKGNVLSQKYYLELSLASLQDNAYDYQYFSVFNNLGNYFFYTGNYQEAIENYEKAYQAGQDSSFQLTSNFLYSLFNLSSSYRLISKTERAKEIALSIKQQSKEADLKSIEAMADFLLGQICLEENDFLCARERLSQSYQYIHKDWQGYTQLLRGIVPLFQLKFVKDSDKQKPLIEEAEDLLKAATLNTFNPWVTSQSYYYLSILNYTYTKNFKIETLQNGISIIENRLNHFVDPNMRTSFFATQTHFYRLLLDIHADQALREGDSSSLGEAFLAAEKIRARTLLDIANQKPALPEGLPTMEEVQEYHRLVFEMEEHFFDDAALLELEKQLIPLAIKMDRLDPTTHKVEPDAIVTHTELQSAIGDPATLVLSYAFGLEKAYLLALDQKGLQLYELGEHASLQEDVGLINDYLQTHPQRRGPALEEGYQQVLARVSQRLLGSIPDLNHYQRLVMVPDSYLQRIPFAAIPLPHQSSHSVSTLGSRFQLAMLPSASVWQALENRKRGQTPASKTIGILANPVFNGSDRRLNSVAEQDTRDFLPALPGTQREAEAIAAIAGKESFLVSGFSANRSMVINNQLADYRYLHFATHGDINTQNPDLSSLVLSRFDSQGNAIPGSLTLGDISQLSLKADLVTLSACETASGKVVRGEGLISLARGFMAAGVPSVVGTLWKVPDDATAEFMTHFYLALLQENQPPAQALRHAQQTLQNSLQWKDPHFWSGFVLMGDWQ